MASKMSCRAVVMDQCELLHSFSYSLYHTGSFSMNKAIACRSHAQFLSARICSSSERFWCSSPYSYRFFKKHTVVCFSTGTRSSKAKEYTRSSNDSANISRDQLEDGQGRGYFPHSSQGLAEACRFVYNDAKYVNERACNDLILLSRGITRLNDCARQHIAVLGLGLLELDARAREDTEKIGFHVKEKAANLHHIATILRDKAQSNLKRAADQHWSDGSLEVDLRQADSIVKRRAMKDVYVALKFAWNIHDMMANKMYQQPPKKGSFSVNDNMGFITLQKNGKALDIPAAEVTTDCAIEDAYWSMASALSEVDDINYTDPEELELLVATLVDLDAMDGKSSVSLLAECSSSPDVNIRKALANALATASSMWLLGNAGMGALQRLAQDSNPGVATAASKTISELEQQWELEEGDNLSFMTDVFSEGEAGDDANNEANS